MNIIIITKPTIYMKITYETLPPHQSPEPPDLTIQTFITPTSLDPDEETLNNPFMSNQAT